MKPKLYDEVIVEDLPPGRNVGVLMGYIANGRLAIVEMLHFYENSKVHPTHTCQKEKIKCSVHTVAKKTQI